ncbi:hypothetical protein DPMN_084671 [Dreissena polymorpha]|uniref:Uncharacterized protein n=1 Tax=Dreissena polymorpha TaxID=45954 RepID=A0A9D3YC78_DREPO|nr:hypothetical protein DPMN_084671 [Dreissena polymorpha]
MWDYYKKLTKKPSTNSTSTSFQTRREVTFYEFFPSVEQKRQLDHQDKATYGVILQLQTGYSILNAHRNRVGINVSPLCTCGTLETTEHFLLEFYIHEKHRDELLKALNKLCGVTALDIKTLLNTYEHPYIPGPVFTNHLSIKDKISLLI